jgi:hypothetical protein
MKGCHFANHLTDAQTDAQNVPVDYDSQICKLAQMLIKLCIEVPSTGTISPSSGTTLSCTSLICKHFIMLTGQVTYRMTFVLQSSSSI